MATPVMLDGDVDGALTSLISNPADPEKFSVGPVAPVAPSIVIGVLRASGLDSVGY
jgi:hypothetical protein